MKRLKALHLVNLIATVTPYNTHPDSERVTEWHLEPSTHSAIREEGLFMFSLILRECMSLSHINTNIITIPHILEGSLSIYMSQF